MSEAPTAVMPIPPRAVSRLGLYAYILAAGVLVLDQISKFWVVDVLHLADKGQIAVLPFFRLTMVMNQGVSFGLLRADGPVGRWLLVAAALAVVVGLVAWVRRADRALFATALGLIIGGALGNNLIDRVLYGKVADFFYFHAFGFGWYVFNVADIAVVLGAVTFIYDVLKPSESSKDA